MIFNIIYVSYNLYTKHAASCHSWLRKRLHCPSSARPRWVWPATRPPARPTSRTPGARDTGISRGDGEKYRGIMVIIWWYYGYILWLYYGYIMGFHSHRIMMILWLYYGIIWLYYGIPQNENIFWGLWLYSGDIMGKGIVLERVIILIFQCAFSTHFGTRHLCCHLLLIMYIYIFVCIYNIPERNSN